MIHDLYDKLTLEEKGEIDIIFDVVRRHCQSNNISIAFDDRAEIFVDAITKYLKDSKDDNNTYATELKFVRIR